MSELSLEGFSKRKLPEEALLFATVDVWKS